MKPSPSSSPGRATSRSSSLVKQLGHDSSVPVVGTNRDPQQLPPKFCQHTGSSTDRWLLGEKKKCISPVAQSFSAALNAATTTVSHHAAHPACPHSAQGLWAAPNLQGHFVHGLRPKNTMGSCKESAALR